VPVDREIHTQLPADMRINPRKTEGTAERERHGEATVQLLAGIPSRVGHSTATL